LIKRSGGDVSLSVVSPSAKMMTVVISPDADGLPAIDKVYEEGLLWITVPSAGVAAGPVPLPAYLAHKAKLVVVPQLATLDGLRNDPSQLPPC
jgi:hypothetical protein